MSPARTISGFTLLELLLVLMVVSIALTIAAPSFSGFGRNRVTANAAAQFVAVAHFARTQAISDGAIYRVNIDVPNGRWWVTHDDGDAFVPVDSMDGRIFTAPEGVRMEFDGPAVDGAQVIEFQAAGRTDVGTVKFVGRDGSEIQIVCENPLDVYHVSDGPGGPR